MNLRTILAMGLFLLTFEAADSYASNPKENNNNMEKLTLTNEWDRSEEHTSELQSRI